MKRFVFYDVSSLKPTVFFCEMGACQSNPCVLNMKSGAEEVSQEFASLSGAVKFLEGMLDHMNTHGGFHRVFSVKITMVADGKVVVPPIYQTRVFGDHYLYSLDTIPLPGMVHETVQAPVNWAF